MSPSGDRPARANGDSVDELGPVFVSYRASDGSTSALNVAWALRATGVPVWHDASDLLPGDTTRRLEEALDSGLSGAVLVVTPKIAESTVVRDIELPALLELEANSEFSLAVASSVENPDQPATLDFDAPDHLLDRPSGDLRRLKQYRLFDSVDITALAHALAMRRVHVWSRSPEGAFVIDIQSRAVPTHQAPAVPLAVRTEPPDTGRRAPPRRIWAPYAAFLASLPRLIDTAGSPDVEIRGGAHLSIAFALGAALPVTAGRAVTIVDQSGNWTSEGGDESPLVDTSFASLGESGRLAAYIDLVDSSPPVDTFSAHIDQHPDRYSAAIRIHTGADLRLMPSQGAATAGTVAGIIRESAARAQTIQVDLFLRAPFPMAVLLGRLLNTLAIDPYEWETGDTPPRYVPTVTIMSGLGGGPIVLDENGS